MPNEKDILEDYKQDSYVYFHKNPVTGEVFYIGMGRDRRCFSKSDRNIRWRRYVDKYGKPEIEIYKKNLSPIEALNLETHLINFYGIRGVDKGGVLMNLKIGTGGMSRYKHSEESRKKISAAFKGEGSLNWGRKHSEETRQKQSLAKKGKSWSEKKKKSFFERTGKVVGECGYKPVGRKLRNRLICYPSYQFTFFKFTLLGKRQVLNNHRYGKKHSDEVKKRMSNKHKGALKGIKLSEETRRKMSETHKKRQHFAKKVIHNTTGNIYNSLTEAGIAAGIDVKLVSLYLRGKIKSKINEYSYL